MMKGFIIRTRKLISTYSIFILFSLISGNHIAEAAALTCGGIADVGGNYSVPTNSVQMTTPDVGNVSLNNFALLYTVENALIGGQHISIECSDLFDAGFTLTNVPAGPVYDYNGYKIYPTSVEGIGVSFTMSMGSNTTSSYVAWPDVAWYRTSLTYGYRKLDTKLTIRVWKTPGYMLKTGTFGFTGPDFVEVARATGASNTIATCPSERLDNSTCVYLRRSLVGNIQFTSGTCEIVDTVQTVQMGKFDGNGGNSEWKDASFRLKCPNAYGYGGKNSKSTTSNDASNGTNTANNTQNQTVMIQILPYTNIKDANRGIIELEPGGAEGYGLQLAWGLPASQGDKPVNAVRINTPINLQSLNTGFTLGPYAYGSNALKTGADNLIPLSARYIRTSGDIVAGPAKASVEILASYQ